MILRFYKPAFVSVQTYQYRDRRISSDIIFECKAQDILEADQMFAQQFGYRAESKQSITCEIKGHD
jgi:hypothetical protein